LAQQTAVEWLEQALLRPSNGMTLLSNGYIRESFIKAKEMEKQQIESAWKRGDGEHDKVADKLAKQYYTETYTK
jgi:hypothetical protein